MATCRRCIVRWWTVPKPGRNREPSSKRRTISSSRRFACWTSCRSSPSRFLRRFNCSDSDRTLRDRQQAGRTRQVIGMVRTRCSSVSSGPALSVNAWDRRCSRSLSACNRWAALWRNARELQFHARRAERRQSRCCSPAPSFSGDEISAHHRSKSFDTSLRCSAVSRRCCLACRWRQLNPTRASYS